MAIYGKTFFMRGHAGLLTGDSGFSQGQENPDAWQPAADVLEIEGGYLVQMDLPGVAAASLEALIEDNRLLVRGVRRDAGLNQRKRYVHMEISRGGFSRCVSLPSPVSAEGATAILRDGVLEIRLPHGRSVVCLAARLRVGTGV